MTGLEGNTEKCRHIARILADCRSILFITGAGVSAASGLPTHRGAGGLYNQTVPDSGMPPEVALAGETLKKNPAVTWKYLSQIEESCRAALPNRAHQIIAETQKHFSRVWVLTQNIDGFHQQAGSRQVIDIHGDMHRLYCPACGWRTEVVDYSQLTFVPRCPSCDHYIRPDVVFFGEMLDHKKVLLLSEQVDEGFDIYFSIGTTSVFPYIQQPILDGRLGRKPTIEINPDISAISNLVDIRVPLPACEALAALWEYYLQAR